jgi:CDP-4-dehydro-6-deoxyglucose reductase
MPTITYATSGEVPKTCDLLEAETLLEGLERHGIAVPNSCRSGVCQSCLMQTSDGAIPPAAQKGLKDSLKARNYFLACLCRPTGDLTVHPAEHAAQRARAVIQRIEKLSPDVMRVLLAYEGSFDYFPGQFVNIVRGDGLTRSYSLANLRHGTVGDKDLLELHVRKVVDGQMSTWLHDEAKPGESVDVCGPQGDCFYVDGRPEQPILLAGTGTGLAPLYAIARDALRQGHTGPIHLYHGARDSAGLYQVNELLELAATHSNFSYLRCLLTGTEEPGVRVGAIDKIVLADIPTFAGWRAFLCGNPELVKQLRKSVFLAGGQMKEIYSDAFVMRASA